MRKQVATVIPTAQVNADTDHVVRHMREGDVAELRAVADLDPATAVRRSFEISYDAYVGYYDDEPVAVLGSAFRALDALTVPWMLGTDKLSGSPELFVPLARKYVRYLQRRSNVVHNFVHVDNRASIVFLRRIGFEMSPPVLTPSGASVMLFSAKGEV